MTLVAEMLNRNGRNGKKSGANSKVPMQEAKVCILCTYPCDYNEAFCCSLLVVYRPFSLRPSDLKGTQSSTSCQLYGMTRERYLHISIDKYLSIVDIFNTSGAWSSLLCDRSTDRPDELKSLRELQSTCILPATVEMYTTCKILAHSDSIFELSSIVLI